jgi:hypothetical protein
MSWEYEAIKQDDLTGFISNLNTGGQGGWELVTVIHSGDPDVLYGEASHADPPIWTAIMKREKPVPA